MVPVHFVPEVTVKAIPRSNQHLKYDGKNCVGPIPKNCDITFSLDNERDLPQGANILWIVRNEGEEAEFANDLGHVNNKKFAYAEENSAYQGTHYMDIIVESSLYGILGFRRIPVKISGFFAPPRNPKKPGYTRINSRRR